MIKLSDKKINLQGTRNARELGGYVTVDGKKVKRGLLLRTAELSALTDADVCLLKERFNLGTVIDFRLYDEMLEKPDVAIDGVDYHNISVMSVPDDQETKDVFTKADRTDPIVMIKLCEKFGLFDDRLYSGVVTSKTGKSGYKRFFDLLLNSPDDRAVLWHCTSGKDRTGIAAALLLSALGVDENTLLEDYLLTNAFNEQLILNLKQGISALTDDVSLINKAPLIHYSVDGAFMKNMIETLKSGYKSINGYLSQELGLKQSDFEELKRKYLE